MNKEYIQKKARWLHKQIWQAKEALWPYQQVLPIEVLEPSVAAIILNVDYQEYPNLGHSVFGYRGERFKPAGLIDRQSNKIAVSTEYPESVVRFTGAHEIGHWLMHSDERMHRDMPLDGASLIKTERSLKEREADYFAACFLMPERLLEEKFKDRFGRVPFVFNEATCFHLAPMDPESLTRPEQDSLDRELALARCRQFNGSHFNSLAEIFRVSDKAMAIRIKELKFVLWP